MIELTTMTIQLIGSEPDGIRICHVEGESLVTVVVPREELAEAKQLPDIPKRGIYYLLDEDRGEIRRVYAGQTTQGLRRLDSHKSKKDFWNKAIMFLDEERNIDRDVLDGLEAAAIDYVRRHGSYGTDNSDTPQPSVSPYKEQTVLRLHRSILFRMAALGYDLDRKERSDEERACVFFTRRNGIVGRGRFNELDGSFKVLEGSQIDLSRPAIRNNVAAKERRTLFGDSEGVVTLHDDVDFRSPSAAAVFVLGGSANGWIEWKDAAGNTLDEIYRSGKE